MYVLHYVLWLLLIAMNIQNSETASTGLLFSPHSLSTKFLHPELKKKVQTEHVTKRVHPPPFEWLTVGGGGWGLLSHGKGT